MEQFGKDVDAGRGGHALDQLGGGGTAGRLAQEEKGLEFGGGGQRSATVGSRSRGEAEEGLASSAAGTVPAGAAAGGARTGCAKSRGTATRSPMVVYAAKSSCTAAISPTCRTECPKEGSEEGLSSRDPHPAHGLRSLARAEMDSRARESGSDAAVRSTDADALLSRCSAASLGYLVDPVSAHFLSPAQRRQPPPASRRPPLINIGTHARTWAVDRLVAQFLALHHHPHLGPGDRRCQVLSLGAGTDSRFWRFRQQYADAQIPWPCARWVELDFPEATATKVRAVATQPDLKRWLRHTHSPASPASDPNDITIGEKGEAAPPRRRRRNTGADPP